MRDRPHPNHRLEWPGGIVPEWAKPQQNPNKRRGKGGGDRNGGSSPSKRERLQKVMAQSGHGSRRNIEILIAQGHITINGHVAKLGDAVGPGDKVKLDGEPIRLRFGEALPRVLMYHKPEGEIVTRDDPEGRATVFEKLPKVNGGRWVSVGRLDLNTGGLLIFTTNGELANRLTHPRFEVEREYAVRLLGELTEEQKEKLLTGVDIEGEACKFDSIEDRGGEGANHWYHVVLREGKNREVRKMCETVGLAVSRLMRVRFGAVELPSFLKRGMMKEMDETQVQELLNFAGMNEPEEPKAASPVRCRRRATTSSTISSRSR
jgi:23S rRNA pseudouridine2605 synthase